MEEKIAKCHDCKKEFKYKPGRYPRKYCDKCSQQRKKDYENLYTVEYKDCED